jgi:hypothetical protein
MAEVFHMELNENDEPVSNHLSTDVDSDVNDQISDNEDDIYTLVGTNLI